MYCAKCGTKLPSDTDICPKCGARGRGAAKTGRVSHSRLVLFVALAICTVAVVAVLERGALWKSSHMSSTNGASLVENVHSVQPHIWHAAAAEVPIANMLLLPKADAGFVGRWGGHVHLQPAQQDMRYASMPRVPMSYYFGQQNGVVFLKTNVYGDPQWPVVKTGVKVITPKSIEFRLDSVCKSCTPPVRQQEVTRLTLMSTRQLQAECYTYAYSSGDGHAELIYKGVLHLLTPDELAAIDREVENKGKLLTTINSRLPVH